MNRPSRLDSHLMLIAAIIIAAALARLIPHPPNATPLAAMALFGGAFLADRRLALLLPLAALLLSDLILGFHGTMPFVYAGFILTVLIGMKFLSEHRSIPRIGSATVASSLLFYVITNFGTWIAGSLYPPTLEGLVAAYVAGLPFLRNGLIGDLFFVALIFGAFTLATRRLPILQAR